MTAEFAALNNLVMASLQLTLATLIAHRAIPSVIVDSKFKAWRTWLLAMALAIFGVAYLTDYMTGRTVPLIHHFGQYCLLLHGWFRYRSIMGKGSCLWGQTRRPA